MKYLKSPTTLWYYCYLIALFFTINTAIGQTSSAENMEKLNFMIGDWVGIATTYANDTITTQVPAYEKISYKLDKNLITIDLQSESLKLHTVIYYDDTTNNYYYNSYYKNGTGKYTAEYKDGKFTVWPSKKKRFIFELTPEGHFREYGEKFENSKWTKYFEDIFKKS